MDQEAHNSAPELSEEQQLRGRRNILLTSCTGTIFGYTVTGTVLNLFAVKIGMSPGQIGVLNSFLTLFGVIQLLLAGAVERRGKRFFVVNGAILQAATSFLFLLAPFAYLRYGSAAAIGVLICAQLVFALVDNIITAGWFALIRDSVPNEIFGRFFGRFRTTWQLVTIVFAILVGLFLGREPSAVRFALVFAVGVVAVCVRQIFISRVPERKPVASEGKLGVWSALESPLRDLNYRRFLTFLVALSFSLGFAGPFIVVYMKAGLRLPSNLITVLLSIEMLGAAATHIFWGKLADNFGQRGVLGLSSVAFCVSILLMACAKGGALAIILIASASVIRGAAVGGTSMGWISFGMRTAPKVSGSSYLIAASAIAGVAGGLGPIVGGKLVPILGEVAARLLPLVNPYRVLFGLDGILVLLAISLMRRIDWSGDLHTFHVLRQVHRAGMTRLLTAAGIVDQGENGQE